MPNITRIAPYYAPDGFAASRQSRAGTGLKYAVAASVSVQTGPLRDTRQAMHAEQNQVHFHNQEGHDEGLVHSHCWASNS